MSHKKDASVGVVPVFIADDDTKLFCLVRHSAGHWGFPKGHPLDDEPKEDTACRELLEETGIEDVRVDIRHTFLEEYSFEHEGGTVDKQVEYFVGFVDSMEVETPEEFKTEIPEMRWLEYIEARDLLTYDEAKRVLGEVWVYLQTGA